MDARWNVRFLKSPSRCSNAMGTGFLNGRPAGVGILSSGNFAACFWEGDEPRRVDSTALKGLELRTSSFGEALCGSFTRAGKQLAVVVRIDVEGNPIFEEIHPKDFQWSVATDTCGGVVVGFGLPKVKRGENAIIRAIVWQSDGTVTTLKAGGENEGYAEATDGRLAGGWAGFTSNQRAALWTVDGSSIVDLTPIGFMGRLVGVSETIQIGNLFDLETYSRPSGGVWKGTPESFQSLTTSGYEGSCVKACNGRFQVGNLTRTLLPDRTSSLLTEAVIWECDARRQTNLHSFVADQWDSSEAFSVLVEKDRLQVIGVVSKVSVRNPGTENETHSIENQTAVIWEQLLSA